MNPTDRKYSEEHEWLKLESDNIGVVGITDYAQEQLGDIVFVFLPDDLSQVEQLKTFGEIESPKAVSELFSPISGRVIEVNKELQERPELVNEDPYDKGWIIKVELSDPSEVDKLMSAGDYEALVASSPEA